MTFGTEFRAPRKSKAMDKIKEAWNENPLMVIAVVGAAAHGLAKLIDATSGVVSKYAYYKLHSNK